MDFIEETVYMMEVCAYCFILGFCGAFGVVTAFWLSCALYEDKDDKHGVIGH